MGGKKSQTVGYRYFVGVHFILCHGPIDSIRAIYVDDKVAWDPIADGARGVEDGYETIRINMPELFGGEEREGGIVGDIDIGMGYRTQPKNGYMQKVLEGKLVPAYRGVVSVILRHIYAGTNAYLKPWKFRVQRIWAPTATGKPQWQPSVAGIGPQNELLPATEAGTAVLHGDFIYRIPADVAWPNSFPGNEPRMNKVTETNIQTGKQETHDYGLTLPPGITHQSSNMTSMWPSRPQQDVAHVYKSPAGDMLFCGVYVETMGGGIYFLTLNLTTRTHQWALMPIELMATPAYAPIPATARYTAMCWVVKAHNGKVYFKTMAGWTKNRTYEDWLQDTVRYKGASYDPATGTFQAEPWMDGTNISLPIRGTGIIATAMKPDGSALAEHFQFTFAINGVVSYYNGLTRYNFDTGEKVGMSAPFRVQAWLYNGGVEAGNPILSELGRGAWGWDDNIYTMMPKRSGQLQNGMLAVWSKTSNPAGTDITWELHWPDDTAYVADNEDFWKAPYYDYLYIPAGHWYGIPVCLKDGRVVFPPAHPFTSGAMLHPSEDGTTGSVTSTWSGAELGKRPWPDRPTGWAWANSSSGLYTSALKHGDNDFMIVACSYGYGLTPGAGTFGGLWSGDLYGADPSMVRFLVSYNDGAYSRLLTSLSDGPWDMNPAHIIRECMINAEWGRGLPESLIGPTYDSVAATLHAEGLGLSMLWTSEMAVNDFILEVMRHIDAVRYEDPETGLQEIKLIRPDYDVATLPVLNPSNCDLVQLTEPTLFDLVNQVTVSYWNRDTGEDTALAVQDTASINMVGTVNNQTMEYSGITNDHVASMVCQRDLARYSKPFRQGRLTVNRKVANIKAGDVFILNWPARGIDRMVCRAAKRSDNGELDGMTGIEFGEDIFSKPYNVASVPPPSGWVDPVPPPVDFDYVTMFDEPYPMLVERIGEEAAAAVKNDSSYTGFAGTRPLTGSHINYGLHIYPAGTTPPTDTMTEILEDFTPLAITTEDTAALTGEVVSLAVAPVTDMGNVRKGDWVLVGNAADPVRELMCIAADPGLSPVALSVTRAVADTYPRPIPAGTPLYVIGTFYGYDEVERLSGEDVAGYGRPKNGKGAFAGPYTYLEAEMVGRQGLPYPAAAFQIDGSYLDNEDDRKRSIVLTWTHRNRVTQGNQQISWLSAGNIGPETGVVYHVEQVALDQDLAVLGPLPPLDVGPVNTYTVDLDAQPYPEAARFARVSVVAIKGGRRSLQNRPIIVHLDRGPVLYEPTALLATYVGTPKLAAPTALQAVYVGPDALVAPTALQAVYVGGNMLVAPFGLAAQYVGPAKLAAPTELQAVYVGQDKLAAPTELQAVYVGQDKLAAPFDLAAQYVGQDKLAAPFGLAAQYVGQDKLAAPTELQAVYVGPAKLAAPTELQAVYVGPAKLAAPFDLAAQYVGQVKLAAPFDLAAQYVGQDKLVAPTTLQAFYVGPAKLAAPATLQAFYVGPAKLVAPFALAAQYAGPVALLAPLDLAAQYVGPVDLLAPVGVNARYSGTVPLQGPTGIKVDNA